MAVGSNYEGKVGTPLKPNGSVVGCILQMDIVVVGGGVGGLYTALALSKNQDVRSVQVLEARESIGGRIRTKYAPSGAPLYEEGAWRISNEHERMMRLCVDLDLEMLEVDSEGPDSFRKWLDPGACEKPASPRPEVICPSGTLSSWDVAAGRLGARGADLEGARSGYAGMGIMAVGSDAYGVETAEKATRASVRYYVPRGGMSKICERLREELERRPRCCVHLKTRVVDVRLSEAGCYMVLCEERAGGNTFSGQTFRADAVVAAAPPSHIAKWQGVASHLAPILAALEPVPLLKVFSKAAPAFSEATGLAGRPFHIKANTLGQQIISNAYPGTSFVQLAYCAGQRAEALEHLRLCGDVMGPLAREIAGLVASDARETLERAIVSEAHAVHFWSEAVHVWKPSYKLDVAVKSAQACLVPHVALPRFFLCGEAFSTIQGWGEGALQTAELVVAEGSFSSFPSPRIPRSLFPGPRDSKATMIYDRRLLDLSAWAKVHPGSEGAIKAHLGEDITELWDALMHPRYALGIIFALQVGWAV